MAIGPYPIATATPAPPLDPPAVSAGFHGLRAGPTRTLPASAFQPPSQVVVLPTMIAPAACSRLTATALTAGTVYAPASDPRVVRIPAVGVRSLTVIGTPNSGPRAAGVREARASVRARAVTRAWSAATVMNAWHGSPVAVIRSSTASTASAGEHSPDRHAALSSAALSAVRSPLTRPRRCRRGQ